jgi:CubicO group peptidase (beta-lactamase class C family)
LEHRHATIFAHAPTDFACCSRAAACLVRGASNASPGDSRVQDAIVKLDEYAERTPAGSGVPGIAIAVVHEGRIVQLKGYGIRKAGHADPVDSDTVSQLASVSKPVASTVIAFLAGQGLIRWDDPLSKHDGSFTLSDAQATRLLELRDLFCHRSRHYRRRLVRKARHARIHLRAFSLLAVVLAAI